MSSKRPPFLQEIRTQTSLRKVGPQDTQAQTGKLLGNLGPFRKNNQQSFSPIDGWKERVYPHKSLMCRELKGLSYME